MTSHPYAHAKAHQRWRAAMVTPSSGDVDPVVAMPFRIAPGERVATAGSCFAQHLGARLHEGGLDLLVTESAHPLLPSETAKAFGYGVYTARFGNIYTARQLLQLFRRAYGAFEPTEAPWEGANRRVFDPFRPAIQPGGFSSRREYVVDLNQHLAAVRRMFETADVLLFTLGLTECWASREDGAVFPVCPGVLAGRFDPDRYILLNFGVEEVVADLHALIVEARSVNPGLRMVLTVSPVPLAATAEPRHVWTSTVWSKAVLRVAVERVTQETGVAYFPSYEVVTSPAARGAYFRDDLRSVTQTGVDHVMRLFFRHIAAEGAATSTPPAFATGGAGQSDLQYGQAAIETMCEEARLDAS